MSQRDIGERDEYLLEFTQIGSSVKVTAMDPRTLTEASIVGPASLSQEVLSRQAIQKLKYVLAKKGRKDGPKE